MLGLFFLLFFFQKHGQDLVCQISRKQPSDSHSEVHFV